MIKIFLLCFSITLTAVASSETSLASLKEKAQRGAALDQLAYATALFDLISQMSYEENKESYEAFTSRSDKLVLEAKSWATKAAAKLPEAWILLADHQPDRGLRNQYLWKAADQKSPEAFQRLIHHSAFREDSDIFAAPFSERSFEALKLVKHWGDRAQREKITLDQTAQEQLRASELCLKTGIPKNYEFGTKVTANVLSTDVVDCRKYRTGRSEATDWKAYESCLRGNGRSVESDALAEIYANGWGVKQDKTLAIAIICHSTSSVGPRASFKMINSLGASTTVFPVTFCDFDEGFFKDQCLYDLLHYAINKRRAEFSRLKKTEAFKTLLESEFKYRGSRFILDRRLRKLPFAKAEPLVRAEINRLLESLRAFDSGAYPKMKQLEPLQKELKKAQAAVLIPPTDLPKKFTVNYQDEVHDSHKKWISFAQDWHSFAAKRYPKILPSIWESWLLEERIRDLKETLLK